MYVCMYIYIYISTAKKGRQCNPIPSGLYSWLQNSRNLWISQTFFVLVFCPPGAGNGPKMWPRGPALERRSIVQIRPMAARLVEEMRLEKVAGARSCWSQLFKSEGMGLVRGSGCALGLWSFSCVAFQARVLPNPRPILVCCQRPQPLRSRRNLGMVMQQATFTN